ncbi:hypothetical protein O0L34_g16484 [Tuta absoluta]|nr:hypothetical protein O0L34_g16484 [Tuta absoluta]
MVKSKRSNKPSELQLNILLSEIEANPIMQLSKSSRFERLGQNDVWIILADKLNAVNNGAKKSAGQWKRKWRDLVSNLKKKLANNPGMSKFTEVEKRILSVAN